MKPAMALLVIVPVLFAGCADPAKNDSHTEVFKTIPQAVADRRATLVRQWQDLAVSVLNFDRPDLTVAKSGTTAVKISADKTTHEIDLAPLVDTLLAHEDNSRALIRVYLQEHLPSFDSDRLCELGFEAAKARLTPFLVSLKQLDDMGRLAHAPKRVPATLIVTDLYCATIVPAATGDVRTPITDTILEAWKVSADDVQKAAMANLQAGAAKWSPADAPFETDDFAGIGKMGRLKQNVNAAIILLPQFIQLVHQSWPGNDDLVVFMPTRGNVSFLYRKQEALLNRCIPEWRRLLINVRDPLCQNFLLISPEKIQLLDYTPPPMNPVTRPSSSQPARKPYIVN